MMVSVYSAREARVSHLSVNACLAPVVAMHGLAVTTIEVSGREEGGQARPAPGDQLSLWTATRGPEATGRRSWQSVWLLYSRNRWGQRWSSDPWPVQL